MTRVSQMLTADGVRFTRFAGIASASPNVWMDVYLAAFANAGKLRMTTLDQDFNNFKARALDLCLLND